jgi:hypothetical protein
MCAYTPSRQDASARRHKARLHFAPSPLPMFCWQSGQGWGEGYRMFRADPIGDFAGEVKFQKSVAVVYRRVLTHQDLQNSALTVFH